MSLSGSYTWAQAVGSSTMSFSGPNSDIELLDEALLGWRWGISLLVSERCFFLNVWTIFEADLWSMLWWNPLQCRQRLREVQLACTWCCARQLKQWFLFWTSSCRFCTSIPRNYEHRISASLPLPTLHFKADALLDERFLLSFRQWHLDVGLMLKLKYGEIGMIKENYCGDIGSLINLEIGLVIIPRSVWRSTTRTRLSRPGWSWVMRPSRQLLWGKFSSRKTTRSLISTLGCGICHLDHFGSSFKYSYFHLKQKSRYIILSRCHRLTTEIGEIGLELRKASIRASTVENSSKVYLNGPPIFRMWALKLLTLASQRPPMCGGPGGIKCHCLF